MIGNVMDWAVDATDLWSHMFRLCKNKPILEPQVRPHTSHWTVEEVDVLV